MRLLVLLAAVLLGVGAWLSFTAPADYQQGDSFRILYIHVPSAWMSLAVFATMAVYAVIALVWRIKLCEILAMACAPIGAAFTFLALVTGSLWGRPMWGTYWEWDARLTSMLILLFLYFGIIALGQAISNRDSAAKACAVLAIVGVVNIPIIKYSVEWWNTLHQPATFKVTEKPAMPMEMWLPLLVMVIGFYCFFTAVLLMRMRLEVLRRESRASWVKNEVKALVGNNS